MAAMLLSGPNQGLHIVANIFSLQALQGCLGHRFRSQLANQQVFRVKKTRGAPMGRPKIELLASNGVHICHAI